MSIEGFSTFSRARAAIFRHRKISLAVLTVIFAGMLLPTAAMAAGHGSLLNPAPTGEISNPSNRQMRPRPRPEPPATTAPSQAVTLKVHNNDHPLPVLGKNIDFVRIGLPTSDGFSIANMSAVPVPAGWTRSAVADSGDEYVDFRVSSGNGIRPGEFAEFPISVHIARPRTDILAPFALSVSTDGGNTMRSVQEKTTDALKADVRILSIKWWIPFQPNIARGTEGQLIKMYHTTVNEGSVPMTVIPTVTSSDIALLQVFPYGVPSNSERTQQVWITLGSVAADKTAAFSAGATGLPTTPRTDGVPDPVSEVPVRVIRNYTIQESADFAMGTFTPQSVKSTDGNVTFTVGVTKISNAALTVHGGTLTFGNLSSPTATVTNVPANFANGASSGSFSFTPANFSGVADGVYGVTFTFSTTDHNGFPKTVTEAISNALTIDGAGPVFGPIELQLPKDRDEDPTTAVRNGVALTVSGTVTGTTTAPSVQLEVLDGNFSTSTVIQTIAASSPSMTPQGGGHKFTATIPASTFLPGAVSVRPTATATDAANNSSNVVGSTTTVDNFKPTLVGATATVVDPGGGRDPEIRVQWVENTRLGHPGVLIGGCDPLSYSLAQAPAGVTVTAVLYSDGSECAPGEEGPSDNIRVLKLSGALNRTHTPVVTYEDADARDPAPPGDVSSPDLVPPLDDDAKDGAGNYASDGTVVERQNSVTKLRPKAPVLNSVTRSIEGASGSEDARKDTGGMYHTWNDLHLTVARDQGITSDKIHVLVTSTAGATSTATYPSSGSGSSQQVAVPILNTAAAGETVTQTVTVLFESTEGVRGDIKEISALLDEVDPFAKFAVSSCGMTTACSSGSSVVTATFSEGVLGSSDRASYWRVAVTDTAGVKRTLSADSVTGSGDTRTIGWTSRSGDRFIGVNYSFQAVSGATPYEDLAGNKVTSLSFGKPPSS